LNGARDYPCGAHRRPHASPAVLGSPPPVRARRRPCAPLAPRVPTAALARRRWLELAIGLVRRGLRASLAADMVEKQEGEEMRKASLEWKFAKSSWDISKFASIALVDMDSEEIQVYIDYFDITLVPATIFFFNAHHMKMDSGTPDHTKWIGSFSSKQDFIDVVEAIFRGAMKGKLIVSCPLPPERIPRFQLLFKDV